MANSPDTERSAGPRERRRAATAGPVTLATLLAVLLLAAARLATAQDSSCDPSRQESWPACAPGNLCLCVGGGAEYRRDKVLLNDFVIYESDGAMRVSAKHAAASALDFTNSSWTLTDAVSVVLPQGRLAADAATLQFRGGHLATAVATGAPATFEQGPGPGTAPGAATPATAPTPAADPSGSAATTSVLPHGRAHSITYDIQAGQVLLQGEAWLSNGCTELSHDSIVYDVEQKSIAAPAGGGLAGRVQAVIRPQCRPAGRAPGSTP
jgi:lipopolysaccharide export system protein LptA